ncbi:MAG: DUF3408 domain-containing protein, partial [Muribaculum sp.]|nr:DUF3408 domain-containing protein [Muribaculum sp.]
DKTSKKSKSAKRVNQPQSDNAANSSDSLNSENPMKTVKSRNVVIDPNLFADEPAPSATPEGTSEQCGISSTDSKNESVELNPANSSDEKKSSDGDVALDLDPPKQSKELDMTPDASSSHGPSSLEEMDSSSEINMREESDSVAELAATEESVESVEQDELNKSEESNSDVQMVPSSELTPPNESKPTRVSAKMRRQELDDYVEQFLQPGQIAKRHTVVIEEETWKRISYNVRKIGLEDSTGSAYVEAIIRDHLDRYEDKVEEWRKL